MRLKKTFYIFLISFILLNLSLIYATSINMTNSKYLRIHVVANSDSIDDQLLKYKIAKEVDKYIQEITKTCVTKQECKQVIEEHMQNLLTLCNRIIINSDLDYTVKAYLGKIQYKEKQKNNICMPKGTYDSLKIIIGAGNGENWWSLIYPTNFENTSTEDTFSEDVTYTFKVFEVLKNIFL